LAKNGFYELKFKAISDMLLARRAEVHVEARKTKGRIVCVKVPVKENAGGEVGRRNNNLICRKIKSISKPKPWVLERFTADWAG